MFCNASHPRFVGVNVNRLPWKSFVFLNSQAVLVIKPAAGGRQLPYLTGSCFGLRSEGPQARVVLSLSGGAVWVLLGLLGSGDTEMRVGWPASVSLFACYDVTW